MPRARPVADVGEGLRHLVEGDRAVDVDPHLSGEDAVGERREVRRPRPHRQNPDPPSGRAAPSDRADRDEPQQGARGAADAPVRAPRPQRAAVGEHRPPGHEVEDEVERVAPGPVVGTEVDDVIGSERPHEVELAGVVDTRDVGTRGRGQLDGERARPAPGPVDEDAVTGSAPAVPWRAIAPAWGMHEASANDRPGGFRARAETDATASSAKPPRSARLSP